MSMTIEEIREVATGLEQEIDNRRGCDRDLLVALSLREKSAMHEFLNHFKITAQDFREYVETLRCIGGKVFPSISELLERAEDLACLEGCLTAERHVLGASLLYPDGFLLSLAVELRKEGDFANYLGPSIS